MGALVTLECVLRWVCAPERAPEGMLSWPWVGRMSFAGCGGLVSLGQAVQFSVRTQSHLLMGLLPSRPPEEPTTWTGYFGKVLMASTSYLPSQVTEMFNQGRAFATVRLPFCGHKNICSLTT